jgi:hypothetical protein
MDNAKNLKFPFIVLNKYDSIVDSYKHDNENKTLQAVITDDLLLFLNQMKEKSIPYMFKPGIWNKLMEPIMSKYYLIGEQSVIVGENNVLIFPDGSVIHDLLKLMKEYRDLFPFDYVDWTHAHYECHKYENSFGIKLFVNISDYELLCVMIWFHNHQHNHHQHAHDKICYRDVRVEFYYCNINNNKIIIIDPLKNEHHSGYTCATNGSNVLSNTIYSSFDGLPSHCHPRYCFWTSCNSLYNQGYHPAIINLDRNEITGNTIIKFRFYQQNKEHTHNGRPSQIIWEQTATGETVQITYSFQSYLKINYFPLFVQLYPNQSYISNTQLKCFPQMAAIFNHTDFQNIVLALPWLAVECKTSTILLSNDMLGLIFHFLFPDMTVGFLTKMIELSVSKLIKRKNTNNVRQ